MRGWSRGLAWGTACAGMLTLGVLAAQPALCFSEILRADPDGTNLERVLTREAALAVGDIAFGPDVNVTPMYWAARDPLYPSEFPREFLQRAGTNGNGIQDLGFGSGPIAFHPGGNKMFFVGRSDCVPCDTIFRADLDGSNRETLIFEVSVNGLAIDTWADKMYWSSESYAGVPAQMWSADLDGSQPQPVFEIQIASSIAIDVPARKIYWAEAFGGAIRRSNLNGSAMVELVAGLDYTRGLAIDPAGDRMWWTEPRPGTVKSARLDGTDVMQVVAGLDWPNGIAYLPSGGPEGGKIYFVANPELLDHPVPASSRWGALALVALLISASTLVLLRRRSSRRFD